MRSHHFVINVYKKNNIKSGVATQLLYGDTFKKLKKVGTWIKIKNDRDGYIGYIKNQNFLPNQKNTHKICSLSATIYSKPNIKYKIKNKLAFGSRIKILETKRRFCKFDHLWIKKEDLKKIGISKTNLFYDIKKFVNVKYRWGGKHFNGVDCSGLIQLLLENNNKFCPRDTVDQIKYFKKKIKLKNLRKNDLIFWKGHVAVAISKKKLIHAYGPFKKVVIMPTKKAVKRIHDTANLHITGVRRIY